MRLGIVCDAGAAEALKGAILAGGGHEVAWIACSDDELRSQAAGDSPDLVLVDLRARGVDGLDATRWIVSDTTSAVLVAEIATRLPARSVRRSDTSFATRATSIWIRSRCGTMSPAEAASA